MARILRRPKAIDDVEEIAKYIADDSVDAALRFLTNAEATVQRLAESPGLGSPYSSEHPQLKNLRACRVLGFPKHVVFYFELAGAIEVIRILHGARDLDLELQDS